MAAKQRMSELNGQEFANMAWALATKQANTPLFAVLAMAAQPRMGELNGQHLAS